MWIAGVHVPSLLPAGCQSVHRGSVGGAGPSEESKPAMSSGRSRRPSADTTTPASSEMANVERILKNERIFSFHSDNNNVLSRNEMQVRNPLPKGATIGSLKHSKVLAPMIQ
jgi:hypothetical protein